MKQRMLAAVFCLASMPAFAQEEDVQLSEGEQYVIQATNEDRARHNLPALVVSKELMERTREVAQHFADRHAANAHSGDNVWENACCAPASPLTAEQAMRQWFASPGHHSNILQRQATKIGVGVGVDERGNNYWYQQFSW